MQKIGFLGPKGTFSQEAVEAYMGDRAYEAYPCGTISDVLLAVQNGEIDEGVAPLENSLDGAVNVTLDMLAMEVDLKIIAEIIVPVKQNLLVPEGSAFSDIKCILSHPQGIGQCRKYIDVNFPGVQVKPVYSTAGAAEEASKGGIGLAAIGSVAAAKVYGLDILAYGIQDNENNFTRFAVVSKKDSLRTGRDKTSMVFSTDNKPGSLYRILDIFNLWDINMARIESRPAKNKLGQYIFFVDINGHIEDGDVRDAITMIKRKTSFFKFLGSYPEHVVDKCHMV